MAESEGAARLPIATDTHEDGFYYVSGWNIHGPQSRWKYIAWYEATPVNLCRAVGYVGA